LEPNCTVAGLTAIESSAAASTVNVSDPLTDPEVAEMTAVPLVFVVARPDELTVATSGLPELHVTEPVISLLLESEYVPVAWNWAVSPAATEVFALVTEMAVSVRGGVVVPDWPPPEQAVSEEKSKPDTRRPGRRRGKPMRNTFISGHPVSGFLEQMSIP
jgi:hypothetical protein